MAEMFGHVRASVNLGVRKKAVTLAENGTDPDIAQRVSAGSRNPIHNYCQYLALYAIRRGSGKRVSGAGRPIATPQSGFLQSHGRITGLGFKAPRKLQAQIPGTAGGEAAIRAA
jgi:hypothetical protein